MKLYQKYTKCLSQASYFIESAGTAVVIDPIRDVDEYLNMAAEANAKIKYVLISHFHADFVSGQLELMEKTGATILFGPLATPGYPAYIASDHEFITVGDCRIEILHTPGHTIESTCFLLYDERKEPCAVFTGDTLFIGDTGRPDLLSGNLSATELGGMLYDSIQSKLKTLPDHVIVYPGHGAGSACGKNLGSETWSTIEVQKKTNYALRLDKEAFIKEVTTDQPPAPAYFFKDAGINKEGHDLLDAVLKNALQPLTPENIKMEISKGAIILDTRKDVSFIETCIKGSIHIGLEGTFAIWAGTLFDFNTPLVLVTDKGMEKETAVRLARIGYDNQKGYLDGGIEAWINTAGETDFIQTIEAKNVTSDLGKSWTLLDVRNKTEVEKERLPGSIHIPLEALNQQISTLNSNNQYAVYCAGGYRSLTAVSLLKRKGFKHVLTIEGGINEIKKTIPELIETPVL